MDVRFTTEDAEGCTEESRRTNPIWWTHIGEGLNTDGTACFTEDCTEVPQRHGSGH